MITDLERTAILRLALTEALEQLPEIMVTSITYDAGAGVCGYNVIEVVVVGDPTGIELGRYKLVRIDD